MGFARTISKNPKSHLSRLQQHAKTTLGVIYGDNDNRQGVYRDEYLNLLDSYYEGTQYDDLQDWNDAAKSPTYVPIRERKPRIYWNVPKIVVGKVAAKLIGSSTFPNFVVEDDDDDTEFFKQVQKACRFKNRMIEPVKNILVAGAVFVRYSLINGFPLIEYTKSKYCYPKFDDGGELEELEIKYVYEDSDDLDPKGNPRQKWYRCLLTKTADIEFDNPEFRPGAKPTFVEVSRNDHGLGWVQGEWFCTHKDKHNYDGYGIFSDILGFIDELAYSLSQSSAATSYNQDPQLTFTKMDEDEVDGLVRSAEKAWTLGREGEAKFLESDLKGVEQAGELRSDNIQRMLDVVRICLHDPDKISGAAQSGEALKQLYAPLIELVDEIRAAIEQSLINLLIKIGMTLLHYNAMGQETVLEAPDGYMPKSVDITVQWPPIFPVTLTDIFQMAQAAQIFSANNIISRESLTRWIATATPIIDNVEEELKRIDLQPPPPNPFGDMNSGEEGQQ